MRKKLYILLILSPNVFGQSLDFKERVEALESYLPKIKELEGSVDSLEQEIFLYKNPKILQSDQTKIDLLKLDVQATKSGLNQQESLLYVGSAKKLMKDLEDKISEKQKFLDAEKLVSERLESEDDTKNLNRYEESIKNSKYNIGLMYYQLLGEEEKKKAKEFENANTYVLQTKNIQSSIDKEISDLKKKINESLRYPEDAINTTKKYAADLEIEKLKFEQIKKSLLPPQYDFKFETWPLGNFRCNEESRYFRPDYAPHLLFLKNGNNLASVIQLDPERPDKYNIVYACKKLAQFGTCLENEKKAICKLEPSCSKSLDEMTNSYIRATAFQKIKNDWPKEIIKSKQYEFTDNNRPSVLKEFENFNKLGYFPRAQLSMMINPILDSLTTISASTPEEYITKYKALAETQKKKMLESLTRKFSTDPNKDKFEQTKRTFDYMFAAMQSEMEKMLDDEEIQKRTYSLCVNQDVDLQLFCTNTKKWMDQVKMFDAGVELKNLTTGQCPRAVFRPDLIPLSNGQDCLSSHFTDDLNQSMQQIQKNLEK